MVNFLKYITLLVLCMHFSVKIFAMEASSAPVTGIKDDLRKIQHIEQDPEHYEFPEIHKISNNLYIGKIKERELYLVMERLDESNIDDWKYYLERQVGKEKHYTNSAGKRFYTTIGSVDALRVIHDGLVEGEEKWIAYVTTNPHPRRISDVTRLYPDFLEYKHVMTSLASEAVKKDWDSRRRHYDKIDDEYRKFFSSIRMFVTITSSPQARITSHLGISKAVGGSEESPKGISMDLHSFAAKVMWIRNPDRSFMINGPAAAMAKILGKSLPRDTHIGLRQGNDNSWSQDELAGIGGLNIRDYPPILAFDAPDHTLENTKCINILYREPSFKDRIALTISRDDPTYRWFFRNNGLRGFGCPFIAVRLLPLAKSRKIEAFHPGEEPRVRTPSPSLLMKINPHPS